MSKITKDFLLKPDLEYLNSPEQVHLVMAILYAPPTYNEAVGIMPSPENRFHQPTLPAPATENHTATSQPSCPACLRPLNSTQIPTQTESDPTLLPICTNSSTCQNISQFPPTLDAARLYPKEKWIIAQHGCIPANAVQAGYDFDNSKSYICRAFHNGELLPGQHTAELRCIYVTQNGREIRKNIYEFLVGKYYKWVAVVNGFPADAVKVDRNSIKEHLYLGRSCYKGRLICGKIKPSHNCLYISFGGQEIKIDHNYEILVRRN